MSLTDSPSVNTSLSLSSLQLESETLGHDGWRRTGQAVVDLHRVIDEPLQGCQRADHDDPREEPLPHGCGQDGTGINTGTRE